MVRKLLETPHLVALVVALVTMVSPWRSHVYVNHIHTSVRGLLHITPKSSACTCIRMEQTSSNMATT